MRAFHAQRSASALVDAVRGGSSICEIQLVETIEDRGYSAEDLRRPGVREALRTLEAGDANALVVAKLDRLSRSMLDFTPLMATAQKQSGHWLRSIAPLIRRHLSS